MEQVPNITDAPTKETSKLRKTAVKVLAASVLATGAALVVVKRLKKSSTEEVVETPETPAS